jgi:hypothetical protein
MAIDPLFWEKRVILEYRQLIGVNRYATGRSRQIRRTNVTIEYHPLNRDNKIDASQVRTLVIQGAEEEKQLFFELQQRVPAPEYVLDSRERQSEKRAWLKHLQMKQFDKPVKKSWDYWGLLLISILLGGMFSGLFLEARSVWLRAQLPKTGVHTTGTVIEHRFINGKVDKFFITSEYEAIDFSGEIRIFKQEHSGTEEQYKSFSDGSPIPIIYLPENPKISDIAGNETKLLDNKWQHENDKRLLIFGGGPVLVVVVLQLIQGYFLSRKKTI